MEVAKALGGSLKFVTLAPRTVREMTQLKQKYPVENLLFVTKYEVLKQEVINNSP